MTEDQATHVSRVEPLRDQINNQGNTATSQITTLAQNAITNKDALEKAISKNQEVHDSIYGTDVEGDLNIAIETELVQAEALIASLFSTGLISETRTEMEARLIGA